MVSFSRNNILALVITLSFTVSACSSPAVVGKWKGGQFDATYEFMADGNYIYSNYSGSRANKWQIFEGGRIKIEEPIGSMLCKFDIDGNILTLSGCAAQGSYKKV